MKCILLSCVLAASFAAIAAQVTTEMNFGSEGMIAALSTSTWATASYQFHEVPGQTP